MSNLVTKKVVEQLDRVDKEQAELVASKYRAFNTSEKIKYTIVMKNYGVCYYDVLVMEA